MIGLWLLAPAVLAAEPAVDDHRGYLDQARFFVKKGWYQDALAELETAVANEDGRIDPEAWLMLAQVRFELTDLPGALEAASRAHSYSRDDDQLQQASSYSQMLEAQFGLVTVQGAYANLSANLRIELQGPLFDPNLKQYVNRLQARLEQAPTPLPVRLGLPTGTYVINGSQVSIVAGETASVTLAPDNLDPQGARRRFTTLELSLGVAHHFGDGLDHLLPGFDTQLGVSLPLGPLDVGVLAGWGPRVYETTRGATDLSLASWGVGVRLGIAIDTPLGLGVRPSLGYRLATMPGVPLQCTSDPATCSTSLDDPDLLVFGVGLAHVPFVELAVRYLDQERLGGLGIGIKVVAEQAFGSVPNAATALRPGTDITVDYTVDDEARAFSATGGRLLLDVLYAF